MTNEQWQAALQAHPEANFLQTPAWQQVNQTLGRKVIVESFGDTSFALMIVKAARRGRYLEIPGGPLLDWSDPDLVARAFARIGELARAERCAFVRFRPQLLNTPENQQIMVQAGAVKAPFHLHAEHTVIIDLTPSEDDLLAAMRRQTRYEVRRSIKLGLTVTHDNSEATFRLFHQVQLETAAKQHFIPPTLDDLLAYREAFQDAAQIYLVHQEDQLVAAGLILTSGREAAYFEAASTDLNRHLPGAYALQWQVIRDLKAQGIARYNLWGIAPPNSPHHRYAGVTTFKTGFGGQVTEFIPAQDIVVRPLAYQKTKLIETVRKKRRHLS